MSKKKRFILALIIAPLISALFFSLFQFLSMDKNSGLKLLVIMHSINTIFTFLGLIVFGLPIYFLLKKYKFLSLINITIAGGLSGVTYMFILRLILLIFNSRTDTVLLLYGFIMGVMTALIFGLTTGLSLNTDQSTVDQS